jgi:hypothetical protein
MFPELLDSETEESNIQQTLHQRKKAADPQAQVASSVVEPAVTRTIGTKWIWIMVSGLLFYLVLLKLSARGV